MIVFFFLQDKLQSLAGEHSDVLENLTPKIRKRVEVLREIQVSDLFCVCCFRVFKECVFMRFLRTLC